MRVQVDEHGLVSAGAHGEKLDNLYALLREDRIGVYIIAAEAGPVVGVDRTPEGLRSSMDTSIDYIWLEPTTVGFSLGLTTQETCP